MGWQTIDAKKIILISRYYKRIGQTTHLRVWLLTFHMKKREISWGQNHFPQDLWPPQVTSLTWGTREGETLTLLQSVAEPPLSSCGPGLPKVAAMEGHSIIMGCLEASLSPMLWLPKYPPPCAGHSQDPQASPHCKIIPEPANGTTLTCDLQVAVQSGLSILVSIAMHMSVYSSRSSLLWSIKGKKTFSAWFLLR